MTPFQHKQASDLAAEAWGILDESVNHESRKRAAKLLRQALAILHPEVKGKPRLKRPVVCRTDPSIRYGSLGEASRALGTNHHAVRQAIVCGWMCRGRHWRYEDTPESRCPSMACKTKAVKYRGRVYPSIAAAAKTLRRKGRSFHANFMWLSRRVERVA